MIRRLFLEDAQDDRNAGNITDNLDRIKDYSKSLADRAEQLSQYCKAIAYEFRDMVYDPDHPMSDKQLKRLLFLYNREIEKITNDMQKADNDVTTILGQLSRFYDNI